MKIRIYIFSALLLSMFSLNMFFITFDGVIPSIKDRLFKPEYIAPSEGQYQIESKTASAALKPVAPSKGHSQIESKIVSAALNSFKSSSLNMPWPEGTDFIDRIRKYRISKKDDIVIQNYPRAYLSLGLIKYSLTNNPDLLNQIKSLFDYYYVDDNGASFDITKVDQVPIGLSSLYLYNHYKEEKYKNLADQVYAFIKSQTFEVDNYKIVPYRPIVSNQPNSKRLLVDVIGMVVPFLVKYAELNNDNEAYELAVSEMSFYIKYGVDKDTLLPFHAINLNNRVAYGPNNWGRGIGWFILGLEALYKPTEAKTDNHKQIVSFSNDFIKSLSLLSIGGKYSQFPGTSEIFDSSATTMILYGKQKINGTLLNKKNIINLLSNYIRTSGDLDFCSGDTYNVNLYSRQFGLSELSQGMLLMMLAR